MSPVDVAITNTGRCGPIGRHCFGQCSERCSDDAGRPHRQPKNGNISRSVLSGCGDHSRSVASKIKLLTVTEVVAHPLRAVGSVPFEDRLDLVAGYQSQAAGAEPDRPEERQGIQLATSQRSGLRLGSLVTCDTLTTLQWFCVGPRSPLACGRWRNRQWAQVRGASRGSNPRLGFATELPAVRTRKGL